MYVVLSGKSINDIVRPELKSVNDIVRPELREEYENGVKATSKFHDRTPGLFKAEFQGTRMIALTSKC